MRYKSSLVKGMETFKTRAENTEFIHLVAPGRFFAIVV